MRRWYLLAWTIRYLRPAQVWARAVRIVRRRVWRFRDQTKPLSRPVRLSTRQPLWIGAADVNTPGRWSAEVSAAAARARMIARGSFCFLHKTVVFDGEPGWHDPRASRLWRYQLHYFDFTRDLVVLAATGEAATAYDAFRRLSKSWIRHNRYVEGDGWHPYTISLRLVNWLHALGAFDRELEADASFRAALIDSIARQANVLLRDLEFDVGGNHLLKNLKALVFIGVAADESHSRRWLAPALDSLRHQLSIQIARDGGHFERTPGYHLDVLQDMLEIAIHLRRNGRDVPGWLDAAVRSMLDYVIAIQTPDAGVPLLKDTVRETAPNDLLAAGAVYLREPLYKRSSTAGAYPLMLFGAEALAEFDGWPLNDAPRHSIALAESGHFVMRNESTGDYLIADVGKPCPDDLPAHAHADMLSYELTADGRPIVVDSGVYEYEAGEWRSFFRSTCAHNTVDLDGIDQSEMWDGFRVARRARPIRAWWQSTADYSLVQGAHDGYRRLPVRAVHRRTIVSAVDRFWVIVDEVSGSRRTKAQSHVHFHPDVTIDAVAPGVWRLAGGARPLFLTTFGDTIARQSRGQTEPKLQGWYSEAFGTIVPNSVLTLSRDALPPFCFGYVISKDSPVTVDDSSFADRGTIGLECRGHRSLLQLPQDRPPVWQA